MTGPWEEKPQVEGLARLREPFGPEHVGLLPKVTCRDCSDRQRQCQKHSKAKCDTCDAWISPAHIHLDYVGHGAVTDRLLEVDPAWNWEPLATDPAGMPSFVMDKSGNPIEFWIRLTVCGVTRLGVGTCPSGQFDAAKVLIGDALRNAAMRFGVALDLWIKGHAEDDERTTATSERTASRQGPPPSSRENTIPAAPQAKVDQIIATVNELDAVDVETGDKFRGWVAAKNLPEHPKHLTEPQADQVLSKLEEFKAQVEDTADKAARSDA